MHKLHAWHVLRSMRAAITRKGSLKRSPMVASIGTLATRGWIRRSHASLRSHISAHDAFLARCGVTRSGSILLMKVVQLGGGEEFLR